MVRNPKLRPSPTPRLVAVGILLVATLAFCWCRTSADPPPAKFDLPVAEPASVEVLAEPERVEPPRRSKVDPELAKRETAQRSAAPISPVAVIRGRLLQAGGAPAADGLVGVVRLANSTWSRPTTDGSMVVNVPAKAEGTAVECSPDGSFELRVGATGRHALVGYEDGWRPTTVVVDVRAESRVDAGTLVLESGHAITGRAVRLGAPLAGATISLAPPRVMWAADPAEVQRGMNAWIRAARVFVSGKRSMTLVWLNGRFELPGQRVAVADDGTFAWPGLAPIQYRLRVVELSGSRFVPSGWDDPAMDEEGPDERIVRAPSHGIVLEYAWTSTRLELGGDVDRAAEGRLVLETKALYRGNDRTHIPEYWSASFSLAGRDRTVVFQTPAQKQMRGEVTFPDREPIALDFWTPDPGGEVVVPVKLVRARPAARLVLAIENRRSSPSNRFTVTLERAANDPTPIRRRVELVEGRLHLDGIQPGPYRVSVCASEDPNHPGIYFPSEFELELRSGQTTNRSVRMRHGAGLRVTLRNGDGEFLRGRYELHDNAGERVKLCLVVADRWQPGSDRWASLSELLPLGIHQSTAPLEPGGYRLDLVSPGYATRRIALELRAGRHEEVDVTLVR